MPRTSLDINIRGHDCHFYSNFRDEVLHAHLDDINNVNILLDNRVQITQKDFERFVQLRRLSTESYVNSTSPLATEWIWYWKHENGGWRKYGQDNTVSKMGKFPR